MKYLTVFFLVLISVCGMSSEQSAAQVQGAARLKPLGIPAEDNAVTAAIQSPPSVPQSGMRRTGDAGEAERLGELAREFYQKQSGQPDRWQAGITIQSTGGRHVGQSQQDAGGQPPSPTAIRERFFTGAAASDLFGFSVSSAGDVNGDGYSDVIVGAHSKDRKSVV